MTKEDAIAKVNVMLGKIFAYGSPKKNDEKQKKRMAKAKKGKNRPSPA